MHTKFAVALLAAVIAAASHAAPTPGVTVTDASVIALDAIDGPWTLGYQFTIAGPVTLTHLGAWDYLGDGFQADHEVGLWTSGGTLLASTTVTSAGQLVDGFRYEALAAGVQLQAGQTYVVAAADFGIDEKDLYIVQGTVTGSSPVSYTGSRFIGGNGLLFPAVNPAAPGNGSGYYGANFLFDTAAAPQALPEPGTLALAAAAALGAAAAARRRTR